MSAADRRRRAARSFTLLEVLVSIALLMALLGALFAFLLNTLSARRRALERTDRRRAADVLVERIEADLIATLAGGPADGPGVRGDGARLRILSRGVAVDRAAGGAGDAALFGDLQAAEYRFVESRGAVEARRVPVGPEAGEPPPFASLGGTVHRLRFRYHDGRRWRDSFDSASAGQLPAAVEVAIWFDPWPGEARRRAGAGDADAEAAAPEERLTFETAPVFDDEAWARRSDAELFDDEPRPDRVRVVAIPDAAADDPYAGPDAEAQGDAP